MKPLAWGTGAAQAGDVQQHIRHAVVGNDETEPLGNIEPFDDAGQFNEIGPRIVDEFLYRSGPEICPWHFLFNPVQRHDPSYFWRLLMSASTNLRIEDNTGP